MSFDAFCREHGVSAKERDDLAWHLAQHRARTTYEMLRPTAQALVADRKRP